MLKTEISDQGCASVILDRPDIHNAFDEASIGEIKSLFSNLAVNPDVRLIVISSTGTSFCSGADLNWMKRIPSQSYEENIADGKGSC